MSAAKDKLERLKRGKTANNSPTDTQSGGSVGAFSSGEVLAPGQANKAVTEKAPPFFPMVNLIRIKL